ncbi:hypothetical protein ACFP5Z_16810, partial [Kocuria oceani]
MITAPVTVEGNPVTLIGDPTTGTGQNSTGAPVPDAGTTPADEDVPAGPGTPDGTDGAEEPAGNQAHTG